MNFLRFSGSWPEEDVLGGDHSAADHEQVHARVHHGGVELLGALRGERAGHGDTGGANLVQTLRDELRLDRLGIDLLDTLGGLIGRSPAISSNSGVGSS